MKRMLFLLFVIVAFKINAEVPPNYLQLKAEFVNMEMETDPPRFTPKQKAIFAASLGATAFIVTEVFFDTGNFKGYNQSLLIGAGVHIVTHVILQATLKPDKYKCY